MKLIESKAELVLQQEGLEGVYKQIELCGRTCYKSEDKITEDSAKGFVERMIKSNHTAMLEHGTIYLAIPIGSPTEDPKYMSKTSIVNFFANNPYSVVKEHLNYSKVSTTINGKTLPMMIKIETYYVTTNLRVLIENKDTIVSHIFSDELADDTPLDYVYRFMCSPTEYHERRYTIHFITDRGVSHELVRHRTFSFAQESTRYCNYSKNKFGKELTFIIPSWAKNRDEISYTHHFDVEEKEKLQEDFGASYGGFIHQLSLIEDEYLYQLEQGRTPQEARQVLPNALKTEVCMTGFASDWRFFFDLRYYGETGKPHPDMELLAGKARNEFINAGLWDNIMAYPTKFDRYDTEG
jgi:thymidylate synthase (FAD)